MKNKLLSLFAVSFITLTGFTQSDLSQQNSDNVISNTSITLPRDTNYRGSHYEADTFEQGLIFKNDKPVAVNVGIRYNVVRDEIEIKKVKSQPDAQAKVLVKSPKIYTKILDKEFVYLSKKEGVSKPGYFVLLHNGEQFSLYKKLTKEYIAASPSVNSFTQDSPAVYKEKESYFLANHQSGTFTLLEKSKKERLGAFELDKKKMKKIVKENGLNPKREKDLIELVELVNNN